MPPLISDLMSSRLRILLEYSMQWVIMGLDFTIPLTMSIHSLLLSAYCGGVDRLCPTNSISGRNWRRHSQSSKTDEVKNDDMIWWHSLFSIIGLRIYFCKTLTSVFTLSLETAAYPMQWKDPYLKKVYRPCIENYIPIVNLCKSSKVFESALYGRLSWHIHPKVTEYQPVFIKGRSTVNNLIYNYWRNSHSNTGLYTLSCQKKSKVVK